MPGPWGEDRGYTPWLTSLPRPCSLSQERGLSPAAASAGREGGCPSAYGPAARGPSHPRPSSHTLQGLPNGCSQAHGAGNSPGMPWEQPHNLNQGPGACTGWGLPDRLGEQPLGSQLHSWFLECPGLGTNSSGARHRVISRCQRVAVAPGCCALLVPALRPQARQLQDLLPCTPDLEWGLPVGHRAILAVWELALLSVGPCENGIVTVQLRLGVHEAAARCWALLLDACREEQTIRTDLLNGEEPSDRQSCATAPSLTKVTRDRGTQHRSLPVRNTCKLYGSASFQCWPLCL